MQGFQVFCRRGKLAGAHNHHRHRAAGDLCSCSTYSLVPNSHEIKGIPLPQMMDNLGIEEGKEQMDIDA